MKNLNNILVIRTDRIGDVVLTTPVIKTLRKAYPMARISVLVSPSTKDLVQGNPYLDEIILDDREGAHRGFLGFLRLICDIRRGRFDVAFVYHTKRRYNLASFLAGIPHRVGYKNKKFGFLLNHPIKDIRSLGEKHEAQFSMDVLKEVGIEASDFDFFIPTNKDAEHWANHWLVSEDLKGEDFIAIHASSSNPQVCWPAQRFAKLIDSLQKHYSFKIVLIGSPQTTELYGDILRLTSQKPLNLGGQTSLAQTASLLRRCRLLISNDSGPVHLAAALGVPVIAIFVRNQPGVNPERWRPFSDKGIYLYSPKVVEVQEVLDNVERIFRKDHQEFFHW